MSEGSNLMTYGKTLPCIQKCMNARQPLPISLKQTSISTSCDGATLVFLLTMRVLGSSQ